MKKNYIWIFLLCIFISSCSSTNKSETAKINWRSDLGIGEFKGMEYGINLNSVDPTGTASDLTISSDLAMLIGDAVLQEHYGKNSLPEGDLTCSEIGGGQYYLVSRWTGGTGGDYNVAINKKDGKIMKVWMGE